jgi:hypothetical protein
MHMTIVSINVPQLQHLFDNNFRFSHRHPFGLLRMNGSKEEES